MGVFMSNKITASEQVLKAVGDGYTTPRDIAKATGIKASTVRNALRRHKKNGDIVTTEPYIYQLAIPGYKFTNESPEQDTLIALSSEVNIAWGKIIVIGLAIGVLIGVVLS